jgi:hypothetical protein
MTTTTNPSSANFSTLDPAPIIRMSEHTITDPLVGMPNLTVTEDHAANLNASDVARDQSVNIEVARPDIEKLRLQGGGSPDSSELAISRTAGGVSAASNHITASNTSTEHGRQDTPPPQVSTILELQSLLVSILDFMPLRVD